MLSSRGSCASAFRGICRSSLRAAHRYSTVHLHRSLIPRASDITVTQVTFSTSNLEIAIMAKNQQSKNVPESTRFDAFVVEKYTDRDGNEKSRWIQLGVAFPHNDGKGFNVKCVALPVNGELVLRAHEPRTDSAE